PSSLPVRRRLSQVDFDVMPWPQTPEEGVIETCRLSDDLHAIALAGARASHPQASPAEVESLLAEFHNSWGRIEPRVQVLRGSGFAGYGRLLLSTRPARHSQAAAEFGSPGCTALL